MKEFLNRLGLSLIILTYIGLVSALYDHLNPFLVFLGLLCSIWRIANFYGRLPLPARLLLNFITIVISLITILLVYQQGFFNIMLHLIMLGFSLKFLELKSIRDIHFFVNTGFVLIALFLIFNYSIAMAMVAALLTLLLLAILLTVHGANLAGTRFVKLLLKSSLLSLPLALLLFIVIPRLPSLWQMPLQKQATTGLSDTVSPGQIAELSRSSALAFRASFSGDPVSKSELYWRVMTLDDFDGQTWSQSPSQKVQEQQAKNGLGVRFKLSRKKNSYDLIVEPHYNYWIPVLDYGDPSFGRVSLSDYSLRNITPVVKREPFNVNLYQQIKAKPITKKERQQLLTLPSQGNLKTQNWIAAKIKQGVDKKEILNQLLNSFATGNFRYTLKPPPLGIDQVDDFLFSTQAGFCVHYASSYLYVARLLGFPARMVTGYLGGEWQADDKFISIRQYDAHAWVEIWQDDRWLRVDPTAYIAPDRVELGLEQGLTNSAEFLADEYLSLQKWRNIRLLNQLRTKIAQIDYLWATWVVNYDNQKQLRLMHSWFAKFHWLNFVFAVFMMMISVFLIIVLLIFKPWIRRKFSGEDKLYLQLQRYYSKKGVVRQKGQTVTEFCQLACAKSPFSSALFENFSLKYNSLKYEVGLSASARKKRLKQLRFICKQIQKG
ncbi:MAG: transglutaminase-like putative cysteine protease [Psychromonas sp.]|jgi:transglutaminase-like putative cysteine protease|uniref:transglutaminase family protein n=1 Tax=Psychromonas sp. TaxID=1884585 RepID=UPI0039E4544A